MVQRRVALGQGLKAWRWGKLCDGSLGRLVERRDGVREGHRNLAVAAVLTSSYGPENEDELFSACPPRHRNGGCDILSLNGLGLAPSKLGSRSISRLFMNMVLIISSESLSTLASTSPTGLVTR